MANKVNITSNGIRKVLRNYNSSLAIAEYIWNGFDAKADTIKINYAYNELGVIEFISIIDNGSGIAHSQLGTKFNPFYESEKLFAYSAPKHTSIMHGKNGVGRLTFFTFANFAEWKTTCKNLNDLESCIIQIEDQGLNTYAAKLLEKPLDSATGTSVTFTNVYISREEFESTILPFLVSEFCWFLELNKGRTILINNKPMDYNKNIIDYEENIEWKYDKSNTFFTVRYVQWKTSLHKEFSKIYFLNSKGNEIYKDYTTLNQKGDEFFHSVYIKSNFFDNFNFRISETTEQLNIFNNAKSSPEYRFLTKKVNDYLRAKRKPFVKVLATKLVEQYEVDGIFPVYSSEWEEKYKKQQLEETIIGLYEAQPKLFNSLNINQKKTFVRFLDLLLDSNERDRLFGIIEEIIELDPEEREDLSKLFITTSLNKIIECIKLIEDRYKIYYQIKDLVFNPDLKANEVDHLQKVIESHYWLFGEQYHLVTAAEPKFEEALRRFTYYLTAKDTSPEIEHPHKMKEMDIFACRQNVLVDRIESVVVELKHPLIALGEEQYSQVHKYLQVITSQPEFNATNMYWEFYLVGCKFNTSKFIEDQIETNKNHGVPSLILSKDNGRIKVYAKKWSEVFAEFEIKHKHLDDKLKLERTKLFNELKTANDVVAFVQTNSAVQPKEIEF